MPAVDRQFRSRGVNQYVPRMAYATNMVHTQPVIFSLGTPAAVVANSILAAGSAQATVNVMQFLASVFTMVEPYGRTLRVTPSGDPGNSFAVDIFGEDYLGQPMAERFTGASGSTAILYGKKAFYRVISWVTRVVSTNAITIAVGTGFRLGLPYKSDIVWNMEALLPVNTYKRDTQFQHERAAAFAITGGSTFIRAPFPGFVKNLFAYADSAGGGANPVITVKLGGTAITGLTVTLVDNTPGILQQGVPTTAGYNANNRFIKDQMIEMPQAQLVIEWVLS